MEEAQIQIRIDAAVAAALEAAGAAPGAPPNPPAVATFARSPAQFNAGILNYGSSEGMKVYQAAIAALTTRYNGKSNDMHIFLKHVQERAQLSGWEDIINIPKDGGTKNVIDEYGLIGSTTSGPTHRTTKMKPEGTLKTRLKCIPSCPLQ